MEYYSHPAGPRFSLYVSMHFFLTGPMKLRNRNGFDASVNGYLTLCISGIKKLRNFPFYCVFALNLTSQVFSPMCQTALSYPTLGIPVKRIKKKKSYFTSTLPFFLQTGLEIQPSHSNYSSDSGFNCYACFISTASPYFSW